VGKRSGTVIPSDADLVWAEESSAQGLRERTVAKTGPGDTLETGDVHEVLVWASGSWEIRGRYYAVPVACGVEVSPAAAKLRALRVLRALVERLA
jgi:hypothetical protein